MKGRIKSHVVCNGSMNAVCCCLIVLFIRFVNPFVWAWYGEVNICRMPNCVSNACSTSPLNCGPWSDRMRAGQPCGKMIRSINFVAMVTAQASRIAVVSVHRVKYSVMTKIYLFPVWDSGKGPMISHPINSKGSETIIGWSRPSLEWGGLICWHEWHYRM